jgi:hypothetical protein
MRWLSEPMLAPDDGASAGGGNGEGNSAGEGNESKDGKAETKTETEAGKTSGNKGKAVTVEIEGVTYVVQDHVNKLVGDARNEGKNTGRTEYEKELQTKELTDQQQYKPLYEKASGEVEELKAKIAEMELDGIRQKVGAKFNLSQTLISRLVGKNEAEIEADAKEVAKELGIERKPVDTEGGNGARVRGNNQQTKLEKTQTEETRRRTRPFAFQTANDVSWNRDEK